jgi:peptide/nickel transport system substrate-binding protein
MESALKAGSIDVMGRAMTADQIGGLDGSMSQNITLVQAPSTQIRLLGFNTDEPSVRNAAVRRAIAQTVDRAALVRDVYARTAQPLYSMVPQGVTAHVNSFFDLYGEPNPSAARSTLDEAGVTTPVPLTLTYTTDHYGSATAKEFEELKKQLQASGLLIVTLQGKPWDIFRPAVTKGEYAVYGMGWSSDYPDPDDFVGPFFGKDNSLGSTYHNQAIESQLLPATRQSADRASASAKFQQIQDDLARDVPFLPLWQGKQYLATRSDITGAEWALNTSSQLEYWNLGRGLTGG